MDDLARGIVRGWRILVVSVVVFVALAVGAFFVLPQSYSAVAVQTVEPISGLSAGSSLSTVNMETERVVATSTTVLERAVQSLGDGTTIEQLSEATEVSVPRGSQVLELRVTSAERGRVAVWANQIARAYGEQRLATARQVAAAGAAELGSRIEELRGQIAGGAADAGTQAVLEELVSQQARVMAAPFYSGTLITPAVEPQTSNRPSVAVFAAAGAFLGLLVGGLLALSWDRRRSGNDDAPSHAARRTTEVKARN